ncbi:MAG TPA: rRNA pseudouridine synthase [Spirochaetes bacterium]|nr:rRNA pseudouridine synthase [Spirochaetota bacterium]
MRLSKFLSLSGVCSRREADHYIEKGLVRVNGRPAELGDRVSADDRILLDSAIRDRDRTTIIINKPVGYVSGHAEPGYRPVHVLLTAENMVRASDGDAPPPFSLRARLAPAGRLDIDSKGLLILSRDGAFVKKIIGPGSTVEKEYLAAVAGEITEEKMSLLRHGLSLDGKALKPALVTRAGKGALRFVLIEGRKRQIRRMCEAVDLTVRSLTRVRIGHMRLGGLKPRQWKYLNPDTD